MGRISFGYEEAASTSPAAHPPTGRVNAIARNRQAHRTNPERKKVSTWKQRKVVNDIYVLQKVK
jgi:hypothetical protein